MLLPAIGAVLGGIEGYRRSEGNLGAALLGAGLGTVGGVGAGRLGGLVTRFAGQALPAGLTGSSLSAVNAARGIPGLGKLIPGNLNLAQQVGLGSKITKAAKAIPGAAGATAVGLGAMALPGLAGGLAAGAAEPFSKAAQAASGAVGAGKQITGIGKPEIESPAQLGAIPDILSDPGLQGYLATMDPLGRAQASLALGQQYYDQNLANAARASNVTMRFQEAIKDRDFQRSAKAAELGTALATNDALRRQAQLGAQAMGQGILSGVAQAGATQYRYL